MDREQLLNDLEMSTRASLQGFQSTAWTAIPCIVQGVDFISMTLTAQPAIQGFRINQDGSTTFFNYPVLQNVPIVFPSCGGFTITFPIAANDEILVLFSARCIDSWFQSGGIQKPIDYRMHDLSDGFALPGIKSLPNVISAISASALQVRNDAGTAYIEISADGKIRLVSPSEIDITGNLKVTGAISATGEVTAKSATVPVTLSTHVHTGVTVGGGSTGGPVG